MVEERRRRGGGGRLAERRREDEGAEPLGRSHAGRGRGDDGEEVEQGGPDESDGEREAEPRREKERGESRGLRGEGGQREGKELRHERRTDTEGHAGVGEGPERPGDGLPGAGRHDAQQRREELREAVAVPAPREEQGRGRDEESREEADREPEADGELRRHEREEGEHDDPREDAVEAVDDHRGGRGPDREVLSPVRQRDGPADVADFHGEEVVEELAGVDQSECPHERDGADATEQDVPSKDPQELRRRHQADSREDGKRVRAEQTGRHLGSVKGPPPEPEGRGAGEKGQAPSERSGRHGFGAPVPAFVLSAMVQTA